MKFLNWFCNAIAFTIYVSFISLGGYLLLYGSYIHSMEVQVFSLFLLFIGMGGIAMNWNNKAERYING